jgi:NADPH2:quinone reductase
LGFGIYSPIPLLMKSKSIITVNMLKIADHNPKMLGFLMTKLSEAAKDKKVRPQIAKVFKADQIVEAHDYLEGRKSIGKVVIEW